MKIEKRIFNFSIWIIWVTALLVILTSCNPYAGIHPTAEPTAAAVTATPRSAPVHPGPSATPTPLTCKISTGVPTGNLNIRADAGTAYAVIGLLREGRAVTLADEDPRGAWIKIKAGQITGWINSTYCKIGE